ncbi:GPW/gp25 family protein [Ancylobacter sonchi]|uniref:GPW/gp25 family protein n=1 Tax=Ancylobacter sonchi TaxID=1937790 RepID=UPI001BD43096|nr:GPW/gp25 family protein [Ancylobacter sonchi]MBS7533196.1 GPW/gp25 family protein [Ancylobacter sonchi]
MPSASRPSTSLHLAYPFRIDGRARTAQAGDDEHIRQQIEQVLFTSPGERVNRPDFGSGVLQLVFAPNSPELAATVQFLVQGALQQWLGDLIVVDTVEIEAQDAQLLVRVVYINRRTQQRAVADFAREAPAP